MVNLQIALEMKSGFEEYLAFFVLLGYKKDHHLWCMISIYGPAFILLAVNYVYFFFSWHRQ